MNTISFSGGLGNQLFQWAAAHSGSEPPLYETDLHLYSDKSDRKFELSDLLRNCKHRNFSKCKTKKYSHTRLLESLLHRGVAISVLQKFGFLNDGNYENVLINPHSNQHNYSHNFYLSGLFQDANLVNSVYSTIKEELDFTLIETAKGLASRINIPDRYLSVHVRRGDYPISKLHSEAIGQLDDQYFINLVEGTNLPILILTENESDVVDLCAVVQPSCVLTKKQTNSWETLVLMANAEVSVGSNSTLSWWGAYLATKKGALSLLPSQWSQWKTYENSKLHLESVRYEPSSWKLG